MMAHEDLQALVLTFKLATLVTLILFVIATPLAWWLTKTSGLKKALVGALVTIPLVLPPTVIGFYFLIFFSPTGLGGRLTEYLGVMTLPFSFAGLVVVSVIYSLPFVLQPILHAFEQINPKLLECASTLGATPFQQFRQIVLPLSKTGFMIAGVLGFAHTVGEFGIVMMMGGNISGETRVISVQIYNYVEGMQYGEAHVLAGGLVLFSFLVLLAVYVLRHRGSTP